MPIIDDIRNRAANGESIRHIARELHLHRTTVKKYMEMEDFSPRLPVVAKRASKLDPFKSLIDEWIEEDLRRSRKDRRTARRMHEILVRDHGFTGSYVLVQRYIKEYKESRLVNKESGGGGFVDCRSGWQPGTAQCDFGEASFVLDGKETRLKYFVLSFPYSNVGFTQVFGGETGECAAQALADIFAHIGGVPQKIIFDRAAGVGTNRGDEFEETEFFRQLRLHYGFNVAFTNPYAGHEKGNVERKVAALRNSLFCPPPVIHDLPEYNKVLLKEVAEVNDKMHYDKQVPQTELFKEDSRALLPLPPHPFTARRFEERTTDKYGRIVLDGCHFYSTHPGLQQTAVMVGIGAHTIEVYSKTGRLIAVHPRAFGTKRTRTDDPATLLSVVSRNPGAWEQCSLRSCLSDPLREYIDRAEKPERRNTLRAMEEAAAAHGFQPAVQAMEALIARGRAPVCANDAVVLAARIRDGGPDAVPLPGPSLDIYDTMLIPAASVTL